MAHAGSSSGSRNELLEVRVDARDSYARVVALGELDMATAPRLEDALAALTSDQGVHRVVLDLAGVTFIDLTGMQLLCKTANGARRDGFDFGVARPQRNVRRLFVLTGVDEVVDVVEP
jgi:anti-sigma B factor antagonist